MFDAITSRQQMLLSSGRCLDIRSMKPRHLVAVYRGANRGWLLALVICVVLICLASVVLAIDLSASPYADVVNSAAWFVLLTGIAALPFLFMELSIRLDMVISDGSVRVRAANVRGTFAQELPASALQHLAVIDRRIDADVSLVDVVLVIRLAIDDVAVPIYRSSSREAARAKLAEIAKSLEQPGRQGHETA